MRKDFIVSEYQLLEAKADIDIANRRGSTALAVAVKYDHETLVTQLLDAKADVNKCSPLKWSFKKRSQSIISEGTVRPEHKPVGLVLMRRGADFVSLLDALSGGEADVKGRGPFAEYINTVYSERVFVVLSEFFGKIQCTEIGDMVAGYLSHYAI